MNNPCMSCGAQRNAKPRADCMAVSSHTLTRYTRDGTPVPVPGTYIDSPLGYNAECMGLPNSDHLTTWAGTPGWPRPICGKLTHHERHSTPLADSPPTHSAGYDRWLEQQEIASVSQLINEMFRTNWSEPGHGAVRMLELLKQMNWRYDPHCGVGCIGEDCTTCHEAAQELKRQEADMLCGCHRLAEHLDPITGLAKNGTVPHDGKSHEFALELKRLTDAGVTVCYDSNCAGSPRPHQYGTGPCSRAG